MSYVDRYEPRTTKSGRHYCDCGGSACLPLATKLKSEEASANVSTVITVTAAQVAAAKAMVKRDAERGRATSDAVLAISRAVKTSPPPKEASTNMIHARELDINAVTTVSDLFELIDLPYRITKKATLSIVSRFGKDPASEGRKVLRLEWSGEPE